MNIRFKEIDIENFRSIDKSHIVFENQGTVIVKGINEYEDNATSNGSGKSSIFEAIVFALFDETSSGEKDVANRIKNNGFCLNLKFQVDGIDYTIVRESSKSNKSIVVLYKNDVDISARNKTDTNKMILQLLGINKSIFLDSIFLSQNISTNLASLSPTQRKERLEILTNTDNTINTFKEQLKEQQAQYESNCVNIQLEINKISGKKESLEEQKIKIQQQIDNINKQIEERNSLGNIDDIEQQIEILNNKIQEYNTEVTNIDIKMEQITRSIEELKSQQELLDNKRFEKDNEVQEQRLLCTSIQSEVQKLQTDIIYINQNIEKINKNISSIQNSDRCPTCGRKYENVDEDFIKNVIYENEQEKKQEENKIKQIEVQIDSKNLTYESEVTKGTNLKNEWQELDNLYQDKKHQVQEQQTNLTTETNTKTTILKTIQDLQSEITKLNNKKQEILQIEIPDIKQYENMLNDINKELKDLDEQIINKEQELEKQNNYVSAIKHSLQLVTKEFRTYLLQNSITYLNTLLETYSQKLFSNKQDIIHITQDDTKLNIQLGDATYESLSGGEKTRVNIALLLAQKSLASTIGNISCNIIILDEILGYCDAQAEENVINLITTELESLESIYMISHKEIPIGYDTQIIVTKNKQGLSTVRCY